MADKLTFDDNFDDEDDETPKKTQSEIKVEPIFTTTKATFYVILAPMQE